MNTKGHHWLTNARLTKYQSLLCENPCITIEVCNTLNPATLFPVSESPVEHDCVEVLDSVYSSRPDLRDQPWASVDWELYVDGSSFINPQGERCAGYAVVTLDTVVEAGSLPQGTSAQKAELIALIRALELTEGMLHRTTASSAASLRSSFDYNSQTASPLPPPTSGADFTSRNLFPPGIKDFLLLCGRILLLLALLTLIISVTTSWLNSFKSPQVYLKEEEEKNEKRQKLVRKKQQEAQGEKASRYIENVLKPHQEMKLRKLEERFYQMTGEAWKLSSGHKLGGDEGTSQTSFETSNREAAKSQNLPKPLTEFPSPAEQPICKEIPDLPEEPSQTAEVVTVALRCPSGNVLRRRFLKSYSSQVLFDWMTRIGYHISLYSLSTSFPRRPLAVEGGQSLEDIGITVDTVLILEEKEQTN
nr:UBX domain-containing protein 8 isoform X1 [Pan troglodytes]